MLKIVLSNAFKRDLKHGNCKEYVLRGGAVWSWSLSS